MTVDEIVNDIHNALGLESSDVLVNLIVLGEYVSLDPDTEVPERRRLTVLSSEELEPWTSIGMLEFAKMREYAALNKIDEW